MVVSVWVWGTSCPGCQSIKGLTQTDKPQPQMLQHSHHATLSELPPNLVSIYVFAPSEDPGRKQTQEDHPISMFSLFFAVR